MEGLKLLKRPEPFLSNRRKVGVNGSSVVQSALYCKVYRRRSFSYKSITPSPVASMNGSDSWRFPDST